jgi:hypothetical protein
MNSTPYSNVPASAMQTPLLFSAAPPAPALGGMYNYPGPIQSNALPLSNFWASSDVPPAPTLGGVMYDYPEPVVFPNGLPEQLRSLYEKAVDSFPEDPLLEMGRIIAIQQHNNIKFLELELTYPYSTLEEQNRHMIQVRQDVQQRKQDLNNKAYLLNEFINKKNHSGRKSRSRRRSRGKKHRSRSRR